MRLSISFSKTISPETACETSITVARSRSSVGAKIVPVGDRLIIDKAVVVRRTDGLFVKLLGLQNAALDPGNLRAYQCGTVFKILGAMLRPYLLLLLVSSQSLEMSLSRAVRCTINGRSSRERTVKVILGRFEEGRRRPEQAFCVQRRLNC